MVKRVVRLWLIIFAVGFVLSLFAPCCYHHPGMSGGRWYAVAVNMDLKNAFAGCERYLKANNGERCDSVEKASEYGFQSSVGVIVDEFDIGSDGTGKIAMHWPTNDISGFINGKGELAKAVYVPTIMDKVMALVVSPVGVLLFFALTTVFIAFLIDRRGKREAEV